jgi:histidyl-tRNA synthetase
MSGKLKVEQVSGFPEWLPNMRLAEQRFIATIQKQYELFGFAPIETPAVERREVLTAKGGMQRQIFTVGKPEDDDASAELALHFDLTVPLARYVVQHADKLVFPFRRYQIQKVWRGERAQRGRFREFYQCDIDIIGRGKIDLIHDAEIPVVINSTFEALKIPPFKISISNRKILGELLKTQGIIQGDSSGRFVGILRAIDKTQRDGAEKTREALVAENTPPELIPAITDLAQCSSLDDARRVLKTAKADLVGVEELATVLRSAEKLGMPTDRLGPNFTLARGLDYYTGTVYETFITGKEAWGSVCSGGRFDDLAEYFTTQKFPGVGISIGLTRLFNLLVESEYVDVSAHTPTKVLVTMQDRAKFLDDYLGIARRLREAGIPAEVYLDPDRLSDQIGYASDKGIRFALIAGERELSLDLHDGEPVVQVKDLLHQSQEQVSESELPKYIRRKLEEPTNL